jgi:hypothetical protein
MEGANYRASFQNFRQPQSLKPRPTKPLEGSYAWQYYHSRFSAFFRILSKTIILHSDANSISCWQSNWKMQQARLALSEIRNPKKKKKKVKGKVKGSGKGATKKKK